MAFRRRVTSSCSARSVLHSRQTKLGRLRQTRSGSSAVLMRRFGRTRIKRTSEWRGHRLRVDHTTACISDIFYTAGNCTLYKWVKPADRCFAGQAGVSAASLTWSSEGAGRGAVGGEAEEQRLQKERDDKEGGEAVKGP
jgi:hypothetical protein